MRRARLGVRALEGGHAEPVIGRAFARPVGFAHPTDSADSVFKQPSPVIARNDSDAPSTLAAQATPGWESAEALCAKAEAIQLFACSGKGSWIASLRSQ